MMSDVQPPVAARRDHTVYFGKVEGEDRGENPMAPPLKHNDPYFWLRDDERKNEEVLDYLRRENNYFKSRMEGLRDLQEEIYQEHISHIQETDMSAPYPNGPFLYYTRKEKGKSYDIHCRVPLDGTPGDTSCEEILMDINAMAEGKAFCDVHQLRPAPPDHKLLAYSVDWSGKEVYTIALRSESNELEDKVEGTNGSIVWGPDATSFFYTTKDDALRDNKIWRHIVGQPQSSDVCLFQDDDPLFSVFVGKSGDNHTLLVGSGSSETEEVHIMDLRKGNHHNALELVRKREKGVRYSVEMHGTDTLVLLTNEGGAINNKLVLASRATPADWSHVLVPSSDESFMENHIVCEKFILVSGRRAGMTRVWTVARSSEGSFKGSSLKEVEMTEEVFCAEPVFSHMHVYESETFRMLYSSMATPMTWFDVKAADHTRHPVKIREVGGGFCATDYVVERRFAEAPDKTQVPLSIVFHKLLDRSKPQPCMLYGYGSYGLSMDPEFNIQYLPYADRGMIYVIAHIRGGAEMGRAWYEIGAKYLTKRNTFSDFIASAEYLVESGMTTPSQLACEGRSAGGLLVGAVLNMRPDLFATAVAGVPFVDVMTTMCDPSIPLTTGEWEEWGNPNEYKYYDYMLSYSPLDNVRAQRYPHLYVQAGLHDPRVAYWEPAKWVSKLRYTKTDQNEILLNMDLESGHFSAKDRYKYWKESASQQAFVCKHLKSMARLIRK